MTLQDILNKVSMYAKKEQTVNCSLAGRSIYEINPATITNYGLVFTSPTGNHSWNENLTTYTLTLFYMDRLLEDSSNDITIFSASIETLKDIIKALRKDSDIVDVSDTVDFISFTETEKMSDRLAGSYCTIEITVLNETTCSTIYED